MCRLAVRVGLRRPGDRLLGRPLRGRPGARRRRPTCDRKREILAKHNLKVFAISNHLVGQAVCDHPIDERHQGILPARIWGDGEPEGVRQRAAEEMKDTARAAAKLGVRHRHRLHRLVDLAHPGHVPAGAAGDDRARATRTSPTGGTRSSTSSTRSASASRTRCTPARSPTTTGPPSGTLEAIGHRPAFGLNWDPSHFVWQDLDPVNFIFDFADRIYHVDCKDAKVRTGDGRRGRLASHLPWADLRRGWDFVSTGHGDVPWEDCFRALNAIGYDGPISIEWEDAGMDRLVGAPEALALRPPAGLRPADAPPSTPPSVPSDVKEVGTSL